MASWVVPKNQFSHKNWYLVGSIGAISNYVCMTFTKSPNLVNGCGIDSKSRHYWNRLTWIMLPTKIHHQRVVTSINFTSNLIRKLCQIFNCFLKLKMFNLLSSSTRCNNFLVSKNIIFNRGPNMAPRRFYICNHNQMFHWMNFDVNLYFQFSSFNVDPNLLLLYHMQGSKAFLIYRVKMSSLTSIPSISPPFHYNTLFICFFIFLVNMIVIFHIQKWFTCTIKIF